MSFPTRFEWSGMRIGKLELTLIRGDITRVEADAIVNAANSGLLGGGGVDGAIHRAGGPSIMEECKRIGGCPTGSAVATGAGNLRARHVIHAVAPRYRGRVQDAQLLSDAYAASLMCADALGDRTIAFPSLGTGAYGYPIERAAPIALQAVADHASGNTGLESVTFVLFSASDLAVYEAAQKMLERST
jgi:O-acetyl-ADP-ribose deacetylase (regulator of RNase III)